MSHKQFYDEKEVIDSIVDEKPNHTDEFTRNQRQRQQQSNPYFQGQPNLHVQQLGCGCFDSRKFMINFLIYIATLMTTAAFFPGFYLASAPAAIRAAFTLTLLNTFVKPILIFFTFPLMVVTLGFAYFLINGMILSMTASMMGSDFVISNFFTTMLAAMFISILQFFIKEHVLKGKPHTQM